MDGGAMPVSPAVAAIGIKRIESNGFGAQGWGWGFVKVNKGHSKEIILDGNIKLVNLPIKNLEFDHNTPPTPKIPHPDCSLIKLENHEDNCGYPEFLKDIKKELEAKKGNIKIKYLHYDWSLNGQ